MSGISEEVRRQYLEYTSEIVDARYAASLMIVDTDFYRFVWENPGLIPEDYVPPATDESAASP